MSVFVKETDKMLLKSIQCQMPKFNRAEIKGSYEQRSIIDRIEALFLDNGGIIVTREQIQEVATDPKTGRIPENWHQRLSELRTDRGYTILSRRDTKELNVSEYVLSSTERRTTAAKRVRPTNATWEQVLQRANHSCDWEERGQKCGLKKGDIDPIGGGTVQLTPDHKTPHSSDPKADRKDPHIWQALCGRHQVMKKNYWDDLTGKINVYAIVQASTEAEKRRVYEFLQQYFGDT